MATAGGRANWSSKVNWYNGSGWINPKWIAPLTIPIPSIGKAINLTTIIPTTIGNCFPNPFKPEKKKAYYFCHHIHFQINYYLNFDTFYPKKNDKIFI
jgi:hypothetical protein